MNVNLNRVNDIIQEIEKQIRRLDSQVKKVQKVKALQEDMKKIEVSHFLDIIQVKNNDRLMLENQRSTETDKNSEKEAVINNLEAKIATHRIEIQQKEEKLSTVQESMFRIDSEISICEEKIRSAKELITE